MASTFSANLHLELQGTGDNSGTWGTVLNTNALNIVDQAMGGVQSLSLASTDVTVTTSQSQNNAFILSGTLSANVSVIFPAIGRTYFIVNNTTGAFSVTLKAGTPGTTQVIPQGNSGYYTLNVNDVLVPTIPGVPTGAVMAFAMSTAPSGWLECDGSAISRTTYAALFNLIGTTYGSGDGTTTFNLPDLRAYFIRGWDHGRGVDTGRVFGSTQTSANLAHTHTFTGDLMPAHSHQIQIASGDSPDVIAAGGQSAVTNQSTTSVSAGTPTGTNASSGGTESRPINYAMLYCIKAT